MGFTSVRTFIVVLLISAGSFLAPTARAGWIGGIEFDHSSPSCLPHNEDVTVTIDCKIDDPGGARIFVTPYTEGTATPGFVNSGSGLIPSGLSTVTRTFTVQAGSSTVDHVRIEMKDAENSLTLLELFVPVHYEYGPYGIFNIQFSAEDHSVLADGDLLTLTCDYATPGSENVRIYARPYAGGTLAGGYGASGGDYGPSAGTASQFFTVNDVDANVDQVRIFIRNDANTEDLFEMFHPVDYRWRDVGLMNFCPCPEGPAMIHHEDDLSIVFDFHNPLGENVLVRALPFENGALAPGGEYPAAMIIPPGEGALSRWVGSSGSCHVDQIRFLVTSLDQSTTYVDHFVDVDFTFAPHVATAVTMTPAPPAILDFEEIVHLDFNYRTDHPGELLIHAYPRTAGRGNLDARTNGSNIYSPPAGSGDYEFFLVDGATRPVIDQVHFTFYSYPGIDFLLGYWLDATFLWDARAVAPVPGLGVPSPVRLGRNFPNPFNPRTAIPLELGAPRHVRLAVYDLRGRLVRVLADEVMGTGRHEIPFDGTGLPSGSYHYRLEGVGPPRTRAMMLVK